MSAACAAQEHAHEHLRHVQRVFWDVQLARRPQNVKDNLTDAYHTRIRHEQEVWGAGLLQISQHFFDALDLDRAISYAQSEWRPPVQRAWRLRKSTPPPPPGQGPNEQELRQQLMNALNLASMVQGGLTHYIGAALETATAAGQNSLAHLGLGKTFAFAHPQNMAQDLFSVRGSKVIQNMYGNHLDSLTTIIKDATNPTAPKTIHEVKAAIREKWPALQKYQVERIARTETAAVWTATQANAYSANGISSFESTIAHGPSIGVESEDPCDECTDMATMVHSIDDDLPPWHPNAVLEGSTFIGYGHTEEMVRAKYRGPAVLLRAGDHKVTIGPNHPMLTSKGMVRAKDLCEGDQLLYDSRVEGEVVSMRGVRPHVHQVPLVEDAFTTARSVSRNARVTGAAHDFHGDAEFIEHEVDVVWPERHLLPELNSLGIEYSRERDLMWANTQSTFVTGARTSSLPAWGIDAPPPSSVGGGLTRWLQFDHYSFLPITSVEMVQFEGYAFDASTSCSLYCSNGFVVSNCRCEMIPNLEDENGDPWLPPDEPWTGGADGPELPVCGSPGAVGLARQRDALLKMGAVRVKKNASCIAPLPLPGEPHGGVTYHNYTVDSIDEESTAGIAQLEKEIKAQWADNPSAQDGFDGIMKELKDVTAAMEGEIPGEVLVARGAVGEPLSVAGYYENPLTNDLSVIGAASRKGGAFKSIEEMARRAHGKEMGLSVTIDGISPQLKSRLESLGMHLGEDFAGDPALYLAKSELPGAFKLDTAAVEHPTAAPTVDNLSAASLESISQHGAASVENQRVRVYRVGATSDHYGRGVFFSTDKAGAEGYAEVHPGQAVTEYVLDLKRTRIFKSQADAFQQLYGKSLNDAIYSWEKSHPGMTSTDAFRALEKRIATKLRGEGYDSLIYTAPPAPAKMELAIIDGKPIKNLAGEKTPATPPASSAPAEAPVVAPVANAPALAPDLPSADFPTPASVDEAKAAATSANNKISGLKTRIKQETGQIALGKGTPGKLEDLQHRLSQQIAYRDKLKEFVKTGKVPGEAVPPPAPPIVPLHETPAVPIPKPEPVGTNDALEHSHGREVVPGGTKKEAGTSKLTKKIKDEADDYSSRAKAVVMRDITQRMRMATGDPFQTTADLEAVSNAFGYDRSYGSTYTPEENTVANMISNWARTSSDADARGVAMQIAAKEELGLNSRVFAADYWNDAVRSDEVVAKAQLLLDGNLSYSSGIGGIGPVLSGQEVSIRAALRRFIRAQYESTQAMLKEQGITEVTVYRGLRPSGNVPWPVGVSVLDVTDNPLASWSTKISVAKRGHFYGGTMLRASVPAEMILSCPLTGFGCANEYELVVLNEGKNRAWVAREGRAELTDARRAEVQADLDKVVAARDALANEITKEYAHVGAHVSGEGSGFSGEGQIMITLSYGTPEYWAFRGSPEGRAYKDALARYNEIRQQSANLKGTLERGVEHFSWNTEAELKQEIQKKLDENAALSGKPPVKEGTLKWETTEGTMSKSDLSAVSSDGTEYGGVSFKGGGAYQATYGDQTKIFNTDYNPPPDKWKGAESKTQAEAKAWVEEQHAEATGVKPKAELTPEKRARNKVSSAKHALKKLQEETGPGSLHEKWTLGDITTEQYHAKFAEAQAKLDAATADLNKLLGVAKSTTPDEALAAYDRWAAEPLAKAVSASVSAWLATRLRRR